jgi:hypothetical protein
LKSGHLWGWGLFPLDCRKVVGFATFFLVLSGKGRERERKKERERERERERACIGQAVKKLHNAFMQKGATAAASVEECHKFRRKQRRKNKRKLCLTANYQVQSSNKPCDSFLEKTMVCLQNTQNYMGSTNIPTDLIAAHYINMCQLKTSSISISLSLCLSLYLFLSLSNISSCASPKKY